MIFLEIFANVVRGSSLHSVNEPLVEYLGGVDSRVAKQMIQRDDFGNDGDVLARIQEYRYPRQLDVQYRRSFDVEARTLNNRVLVPFFELDNHLDTLLLSHRANSKDC